MLSRLIAFFLIDFAASLPLLVVLSRVAIVALVVTSVATVITVVAAEPFVDVVLAIVVLAAVVVVGLLIGIVLRRGTLKVFVLPYRRL